MTSDGTITGPRGATGIRLSEAAAASLFDEWPASRLPESGVHQIAVTGEVTLRADRGLATLSFVRFLREATSAGVWVRWSGTVGPEIDAGLLCHLPPPESPEPAWRASHEAGLCYYRVGPGFIQVTDRRPGARPRHAVLNSQPHLDLFGTFLVPAPVPDSDDVPYAAFDELARGRLLLRIGDNAITLPHRLLCRPVPWNVF